MNVLADLEPPDSHLVRAAEGWVELGLPGEAEAELAGVAPETRAHPKFLHVTWAVHAGRREWSLAHAVAEVIIQTAPDDVTGWVHRAYAARRMEGGGLHRAWDALRPAAEQFPNETIVPYNLACYACQMGNLDAARQWLGRAKVVAQKHGGTESFTQMALADPDLAPLRGEVMAW
ncbi:MAG: tetratricopeptide repeat protein [Verrucomicrobia bacterium]|nr:tetratricopeptide repeat protein [Verrucomicrobiota bacterium]